MKVVFCLFCVLQTSLTFSQVVIQVSPDKTGKMRVDTIKTTRPDTLVKRQKEEVPNKATSQPGEDQPIFRFKGDSIAYSDVQREIKREFDKPQMDGNRIDSLFKKRAHLLETGITGYRRAYSPSRGYFSLDSLTARTDPDKITQLSISRRRGRKLPGEVTKFHNLEDLELVNTSFARLQRALNRLPGLKRVYIYNNRPSKALRLRRNVHITTLVIRGGQHNGLPVSFKRFKALAKLDLSGNSLSEFPNGARHNELVELNLQNNALTLEEDHIKPHPYLKRLDLTRNKITSVPASIQNFPALRTLRFNFNKITAVSPEISKLSKLEQLSFYNNKLASLPPALYELTGLKEIDLYYNEIERLDESVSQWQNLEVLYLAFNRLYSVPEGLGGLSKLQELYLHDNRLSSIPESIGHLTNLRVLRVNNNSLPELPASLTQLQSLENLDISKNEIRTLPPGFFAFQHLKILAMVANPWDGPTRELLSLKAKELRGRQTVVHLNSFDEVVDE